MTTVVMVLDAENKLALEAGGYHAPEFTIVETIKPFGGDVRCFLDTVAVRFDGVGAEKLFEKSEAIRKALDESPETVTAGAYHVFWGPAMLIEAWDDASKLDNPFERLKKPEGG